MNEIIYFEHCAVSIHEDRVFIYHIYDENDKLKKSPKDVVLTKQDLCDILGKMAKLEKKHGKSS